MTERIAVIAIGSNSTRLLVADANIDLTNEYRARKDTRLFMSLDKSSFITDDALNCTVNAVKELQEDALREGTAKIDLIATSATRDAKNSQSFSKMLLSNTGLHLQILSGNEEAVYAFYGAAGEGLTGLIDIGGGSTELVIGERYTLYAIASVQLGASRLYLKQSVNTQDDIPYALAIAQSELDLHVISIKEAPVPAQWILTGGTGTTLAAVCQRLPHTSAEIDGFSATQAVIKKCLYDLAALSTEERAGIVGLPQTRIDIFPTGLCILLSAMDLLDISSVTVTIRGNTDGWLRSVIHKRLACTAD